MTSENTFNDRRTAPYNQAAKLAAAAGGEVKTCGEPKQPEIPFVLGRAFGLSDQLSEDIARLDARIRPISRTPVAGPDTKMAESVTEIGSAIEQINARMELMLSAVGSMIHRLEV